MTDPPSSVNSIFNPEYIDTIYPKSSAYRQKFLADASATNYSVVRLELIEHLFETMYHQKRTLGTDEKQWPHRIMAGRRLVKVDEKGDRLKVKVALCPSGDESEDGPLVEEEDLDVDLIVCATGYQRTAHIDMLKDTWSLLPEAGGVKHNGFKDRWFVEQGDSKRVLEVGRNYGVRFTPGAVAPGSGVWLQGCCEGTHGVSDTIPPFTSVLVG